MATANINPELMLKGLDHAIIAHIAAKLNDPSLIEKLSRSSVYDVRYDIEDMSYSVQFRFMPAAGVAPIQLMHRFSRRELETDNVRELMSAITSVFRPKIEEMVAYVLLTEGLNESTHD